MRYATVLLICIIAGCATPEQIAARRAAEAQAQEQQNIAYTRALAGQCEAVGYARNSDPWRNCIVQLHGQNQANRAAIIQGIMSQPQPAPYRPTRPRTPIQTNCNTDAWGNTHCSTY